MPNELFTALVNFAEEVSTKLNLIGVSGEPEKQLRAPFEKVYSGGWKCFRDECCPYGRGTR